MTTTLTSRRRGGLPQRQRLRGEREGVVHQHDNNDKGASRNQREQAIQQVPRQGYGAGGAFIRDD